MSSDRPRDMLRGRRRRRRRKKQSRRRGMRGLCAASARVEGEARRAGERVVLEGWQRWQRCGEAGRGRRRGEVGGGSMVSAAPNTRACHAHIFLRTLHGAKDSGAAACEGRGFAAAQKRAKAESNPESAAAKVALNHLLRLPGAQK